MWGPFVEDGNGLTSGFVDGHDVVEREHRGASNLGSIEEHADHSCDGDGVLLHSVGKLFHLFFGDGGVGIAEDLCESNDEVEWRSDLVRHILEEDGLTVVGLLGELVSYDEFLVAGFGFLVGLLDVIDMLVDRFLHGAEAVL